MSLARIFAMADRCRVQGGDCPCLEECKALTELKREEADLCRQLHLVGNKLAWLAHTPRTVRDDWKRPEKPEGDYTLSVIDEGDGWVMHWYSETEDPDYIEIIGDQAWPFVEETAWSNDWERLGIDVI